MRLWTFQFKQCVDTLLSGKEWFMDNGTVYRIKKYDKQYVYINSDGIECAPIYCFCKVFGQPSLALETMVQAYNHLNGYYKLNLSSHGRSMIELNVPDNYIVHVKETYTQEDEEFRVETADKVGYMRSCRDDTEALILSIKPEWVVAIREFKFVGDYVRCTTTYHNDKECPAWTKTIVFDSSYPMGDDCHFIRDWKAREAFYSEYGMKGCPMYYTIQEALHSCETNTKNAILTIAGKKHIDKNSYNKVTITDLLK